MAKAGAQVSDEELLRLMLAGDGPAFEALYDRRQGGVYRFALRMSGSAEIAEDVTHDVFMALIHDGCQFDPPGEPSRATSWGSRATGCSVDCGANGRLFR